MCTLQPPPRVERGRGRREAAGDARATRAVGGSRRRSRAGPFARAAVVFLLFLLFALPVAGRRPRLALSLRPPLCAERGHGARGRRGTRMRRARRACVAVGGSRRRSQAGPFARAAVVFLLLFLSARSVAGRRSCRCLAPSLQPSLRVVARAQGAGRDSGLARDARRGRFSPPQPSRAVRACRGGLPSSLALRPFRRRFVVLVLVSPLLYSHRSEWSEIPGGGRRRVTRARLTPWVVFAAAVEHGRSRAPRWSSFFSCSSPVRSPVVVLVLVSPLLYSRRSVWSEGAGGGRRRVMCARRAPWVVLAAAVEQGRLRAPRWSSFSSCFSSVRSPVVVLVSRLLYGRRSARSEGAARGGRRGTRAQRARVRAPLWVVLAAAVEQGRSCAPRWSLLLLLFSRPVRCSACAMSGRPDAR